MSTDFFSGFQTISCLLIYSDIIRLTGVGNILCNGRCTYTFSLTPIIWCTIIARYTVLETWFCARTFSRHSQPKNPQLLEILKSMRTFTSLIFVHFPLWCLLKTLFWRKKLSGKNILAAIEISRSLQRNLGLISMKEFSSILFLVFHHYICLRFSNLYYF